jgi:hypothetical protein
MQTQTPVKLYQALFLETRLRMGLSGIMVLLSLLQQLCDYKIFGDFQTFAEMDAYSTSQKILGNQKGYSKKGCKMIASYPRCKKTFKDKPPHV